MGWVEGGMLGGGVILGFDVNVDDVWLDGYY